MNQPLKGIKVVDFTLFASAPVASRLLADWGADVIKVEPPGGEAARYGNPKIIPNYQTYNANKKGITINMKAPEGVKIMDELLSQADVFVSNYRPNALERLGLDYETLHKKYPRLVHATLNGYGTVGPDADAPGFDLAAFWARSGAMIDYVEPGSILNTPLAFGDITSGCVLAGGICAALAGRNVTGKGEQVLTSLYATAIFVQSFTLNVVQDGAPYPRSRMLPITRGALNNAYRFKDGVWLMLAVMEHERFFNSVMKLAGREDLIDSPEHFPYSEAVKPEKATALTEILDEAFAKIDSADAMKALDKIEGFVYSRVNDIKDVMTDEQAIANEYIRDWTNEDGKVYKMAAGPIKFGNIHNNPETLAPRLGEHTAEILRSLGRTEEQIQDLANRGVVSLYKPG